LRFIFFSFSFYTIFSIIKFITFLIRSDMMADIDAKQLAGRIDTVLDEILKAELLAQNDAEQAQGQNLPKTPWEI